MPNLHGILRNASYIGVKTHHAKGERKETKAVWDAIVEPDLFARVQEMLTKNFRTKKPLSMPHRYPYLLSGLVVCATCGDRLPRKSANGNGCKIPYFEHGWATKRQSCLVKKVMTCQPQRILAKRLEPAVWEQVTLLLRSPEFAGGLITEARANFTKAAPIDEATRVRKKIQDIDAQLEALAERISQLPKCLAPEPFYRQMERIQKLRDEENKRLSSMDALPARSEVPADMRDFENFLKFLNGYSDDPVSIEARVKIVQKLVDKVEVLPHTYRIHFHVGQNQIQRELADAGSRLFGQLPREKKTQVRPTRFSSSGTLNSEDLLEWGELRSEPGASISRALPGSNTLTVGWGTWIRLPVLGLYGLALQSGLTRSPQGGDPARSDFRRSGPRGLR